MLYLKKLWFIMLLKSAYGTIATVMALNVRHFGAEADSLTRNQRSRVGSLAGWTGAILAS